MRTCPFCGRQGLSSEHIWGKWLLKLSEEAVHPQSRVSHTVTELSRGGDRVLHKGIFARNGNFLHAKRRLVCEPCNNGWMSRLEKEVQPILSRMKVMSQLSLSEGETRRLSRWCSLKAAMFCTAIVSDSALSEIKFKNSQISLEQLMAGECPGEYCVMIAKMEEPWIWGWHNLKYGVLGSDRFIFGFAGQVGPLGIVVSNWPGCRSSAMQSEKKFKGHVGIISPNSGLLPTIPEETPPPVLEMILYDMIGRPEQFRTAMLRTM